MFRRWALALAVLALVTIACKAGGSTPSGPPPTPVKGFPSSMVALGDSVTAGFGSCFAPTPCPRNSWSTGDGTQVSSHYKRIAKANPAMKNHNRNLAVAGITVEALPGQAAAAVKKPVEYVTILIGGNDACRGTMTAPSTFRANVDSALATLKKGMPKARVLMVSLPNIYRVWELGHTNDLAVRLWKAGVCPNLLTNPTSNAAADVARRKAFRDRITAYNAQLRSACSAYGSRCRFDNIAGFAFSLNMLSASDFFHPNASGQEALADETYPGTFTW